MKTLLTLCDSIYWWNGYLQEISHDSCFSLLSLSDYRTGSISALGAGGFEANTFSYFLVYVVEIVESMKPEAMRKQYIFR